MKYRSKPVEIEAVQWTGESNCEEVFEFLGLEHPSDELDHSVIYMDTTRGERAVTPGMWIIKDAEGEFRACWNHVFRNTYEAVDPA